VPGGRQAGQPGGSLRETADHAKTIGLGRRGSVADDRTHRRQPDLRAGMAGIAWHTPHNVHHGHAEQIRAVRADVLTAAYTRNPDRFVRKHPTPAALPTAAWINKPPEPDPDQQAHSTKP
jgi:hypothetical protein